MHIFWSLCLIDASALVYCKVWNYCITARHIHSEGVLLLLIIIIIIIIIIIGKVTMGTGRDWSLLSFETWGSAIYLISSKFLGPTGIQNALEYTKILVWTFNSYTHEYCSH